MTIRFVATAQLPTRYGDFLLSAFQDEVTGEEHVMLSKGLSVDTPPQDPILVRIHSECLTGDAFSSLRCECGPQLRHAMKLITQIGVGAILYLRQEGRGIGLTNKVRAYALQDQGHDTLEANVQLGLPVDARQYDMTQVMLGHFGIKRLKLMTNNPAKIEAIEALGFEVTERVPVFVGANVHNQQYMYIKQTKMRHFDS